MFIGITLFYEGFQKLFSRELRSVVVTPLLISMVVFAITGWFIYSSMDSVLEWLLDFLPFWMMWLKYLLAPIFILVFVPVMFFVSNIIANLVSSPFNGALAEKVSILEGNKAAIIEETMLQMTKRTLHREWEKLCYVMPRMLILGALSFVPWLGMLVSPILFAFTLWMVAFQYIDFAADNQGRTIDEVKSFMASKRMNTLILGLLIMLTMNIPVLNFIVIPVSVIASTLYWERGYVKSQSVALG